jgi:hypothetical protein
MSLGLFKLLHHQWTSDSITTILESTTVVDKPTHPGSNTLELGKFGIAIK